MKQACPNLLLANRVPLGFDFVPLLTQSVDIEGR